MDHIKENISEIKLRMEDAAAKRGIDPGDVTLIAVSKYFPVEACKAAIDAGIKYLGENRAQEMSSKFEVIGNKEVFWNFIGQLQKNKVKYIIDKAWLIQSLDRLELAETINEQAKKHGIISDVLIEVNIGDEIQKGGATPSSLDNFIKEIEQYENIRIKGLMAIPPVCSGNKVRDYFKQMKDLYEEQKAKELSYAPFTYLSMGMSSDFEEAIEEGSNMVRVGTAIFGKRA